MNKRGADAAVLARLSPDREYRVPEVSRLIGVSYRRLDYWARTGLIVPSIREARGSGTQRLYSLADVHRLRIIRELLDEGVSLQTIRRAMEGGWFRGLELLLERLADRFAVEFPAMLLDLRAAERSEAVPA